MWIGGVRVVILDEYNRILMVRQHHENRDIWMVPGGAMETGENARQAAIREVYEETGLNIEITKLIWHVEQVSADKGHRFVNFFMANIIGGKLELGSDPEYGEDAQVMREVRFMSRDEMCQLEVLYPDYLKDELWRFLQEDIHGYNAYKERK